MKKIEYNGRAILKEEIVRPEASGAETLADAWDKASPTDLVWAVTRLGVMSPEQRRQFLVFVLESIEDKLTDPRSKNILEKLHTNSPITEADLRAAARAYAAYAAARAYAAEAYTYAAYAARAAAYAYAADASDAAARAAARAARAAAEADASDAAARTAVIARAAWASADADASDAAEAAAAAARAAARATRAEAREQQARWIRTNFRIADLRTK